MAIPKVVTRAVILVGKDTARVKELIAGGTITPGDLLAIDANGKYVRHATAGGRFGGYVADMADYNGKGIDDNYVANDNVFAWICPRGTEINGRVAAAAPAIAVGDFLASAGDGTLKKTTTAAEVIGQALTAVDNSAGATAVRIQAILF